MTPQGWLGDGEDAAYPPPPWHLGCRMWLSVWRLPARVLPGASADVLPSSTAPVLIADHGFVVAAFARYAPGGVLAYDELLTGVAVRAGARPRLTVPHAWVDSLESRAGARQLWAIPKQLAAFELHAGTEVVQARAHHDGRDVAALRFVPGLRLPGAHRFGFALAQRLDGLERLTRVRVVARLRLGTATWNVDPDGPLSSLAWRPPLFSAALSDVSLTMGEP